MILCETRQSKIKKDPYERTLAELRLFPDRNPGFAGPLPHLSYINLGYNQRELMPFYNSAPSRVVCRSAFDAKRFNLLIATSRLT
jgi:hypothetical protein